MSSLYRNVFIVLVAFMLITLVVWVQTVLAQDVWSIVGLPIPGYNGSGVTIAIISTGLDLSDPTILKHLVKVKNVICGVEIDVNGVLANITPPYDPLGVGTAQVKRILEAAPGVQIVFVKVPYADFDNDGLPEIPSKALVKALEWVLNPYVILPNGAKIACGVRPTIVLLGLPTYSGVDKEVMEVLKDVGEHMLIVVPVGDVGPGIINQVAKSPYVVSIGSWLVPEPRRFYAKASGYFELDVGSVMPYHDVPIEPDYVMPVEATCIYAPENIVTCSELAAAEFTALAAIAYQMYFDLRGVKPSPFKLENLVRASVRDLGLPGKDTVYGWGLPDAMLIKQMLEANSGLLVCTPKGHMPSKVAVEVLTQYLTWNRYGYVLEPGECLEVPGIPGPHEIIVYGSATISPYRASIELKAGYVQRLYVPIPASKIGSLSIIGKVVDEKGVALDFIIRLLPENLWPLNLRLQMLVQNVFRGDHGVVFFSISCDYLSFILEQPTVYMLVESRGFVPRIFRVDYLPCKGFRLGTIRMVKAPKVIIVGRGFGSDIEVLELLRWLGFNATLSTPIEFLQSPVNAPVVIVTPTAGEYTQSVVEKSVASKAHVLLLGLAAKKYGLAFTYKHVGIASENPVLIPHYEPGYSPVVRRGVVLANIWSGWDNVITTVNLTVYEKFRILAYSIGLGGKRIEVAVWPEKGIACLSSIWGLWREGRSVKAMLTPYSLAVLALALMSSTSPVSVTLGAYELTPFSNTTISVYGWKLKVTVWVEKLPRIFKRLVSVKQPYPNYTLSIVFNVGEQPRGTYMIVVNDTLWRIGFTRFTVKPVILVEPSRVAAGEQLLIKGFGFAANTLISILFDGINVAVTTSNNLGSFEAKIIIPSVAPPGVHRVTAADGLASSSREVIVYKRTILEVDVVIPSLSTPGVIPGYVFTKLDGRLVDASLEASISKGRVEVEKVANGVYKLNIEAEKPGNYMLVVKARYVSEFVEARGTSVKIVTVLELGKAMPAPETLKALNEINRSIEDLKTLLIRELTSTKELRSKIDMLMDTVTQLNGSALEKMDRIYKVLHDIGSAINDVKNAVIEHNRVIREALESVRKTVTESMSQLTAYVSKEANIIKADVNRIASNLYAKLIESSASLNYSLSRQLVDLRTSIASLGNTILLATIIMSVVYVATVVALVVFIGRRFGKPGR